MPDVQRIISDVQRQLLQQEYGGKPSNLAVQEIKSAALYLCNWGELLTLAPTAVSLMAAGWIAASDQKAESTSLDHSGDFKYLTNRSRSTLRSALVDVGNNGGREALIIASKHFDGLQIRAQRIVAERIDEVFKRLRPCNEGPDEMEDLRDSIEALVNEANDCAHISKEIREAFTKWGNMVGELYATKTKESGSSYEQSLASIASIDAKAQVMSAEKTLVSAQSCLEKALDNVPETWASVSPAIISNFVYAIPSIVGLAVPAVVATSTKAPRPSAHSDSAYAIAIEIRDLITFFYEALGGEKNQPDLKKFGGRETEWLLNVWKAYKSKVESSNTDPSNKLITVLDKLINVSTSLQSFARDQNSLSSGRIDTSWKTEVKQARDEILVLAAVGVSFASESMPNGFAVVKVNIGRDDNSAQYAQASSALQGMQMTQQAAESAQVNFEAAMASQANVSKATTAINEELAQLKESNQTLDQIDTILRKALPVITDLTAQVGKLERFSQTLATLLDTVVKSRVDAIEQEMRQSSKQSLAGGQLKFSEQSKQFIYTLVLQVKAYFSLLGDLAAMYTTVDRQYFRQGLDLCMQISKGVSSNYPMEREQAQLSRYCSDSVQSIRKLVDEKQRQMIESLRGRTSKAGETATQLQRALSSNDVQVDESTMGPIRQGGSIFRDMAKAQLAAEKSQSVP